MSADAPAPTDLADRLLRWALGIADMSAPVRLVVMSSWIDDPDFLATCVLVDDTCASIDWSAVWQFLNRQDPPAAAMTSTRCAWR